MSLIFAAELLLAMLASAAVSFLLVYALATYGAGMSPSRAVLAFTSIFFPVIALLFRRAVFGWYGTVSRTQEFLVLGGGTMARKFAETYDNSTSSQKLRFISDAPDRGAGPVDHNGESLVSTNVMEQLRSAGREVAGVVIAEEPENISAALTEALVRLHFERLPVYTMESFYETFWQKVPVMALDGVWPLQKGFPLSTDTPYASLKRIMDLGCAVAALIVLAPVFGIVALIVRRESSGPVIFKQERLGWHRQPFMVLKFRTMYQRTEEGSLYTASNDARITRSGRWLRKLRLDELPQLWNVLKGDMSIIGPRAEWVKCVAEYENFIPSYHFRHLVKPGITGWAQVNYPYGANLEDAIQKLKYDLYYIRHYSLKLDAMIVLKTIHVMFLAKGK